MQVTVAGRDRTAELSPRIVEQAAARRPMQSRWPEDSALKLLDSSSADDYVERFYRLLRIRSAVDTSPLILSAREGALGRMAEKIKTLLWKVLRYQHDRITFQQNMINELLINALDFQQAAIREDLAELKAKIDSLQAEVASLKSSSGEDIVEPTP